MNALTSKKKKFILFLFMFLLVNDCILMYLKITILCIYKFLILYGCLFGVFFFFYSDPANLKSWVHPCANITPPAESLKLFHGKGTIKVA